MLRRQPTPLDPMSFLAGQSEMAQRIREKDWSGHPFGPPRYWPQSLRSAVSICLHSAFPTAIYWGPELRLLYNDAWAPIPGPRHPDALGEPAEVVWSDIWHILEPQFLELISTGEGIFVEDQLLPMRRYGTLEETYWSYSFTAIRAEDGAIAGVFNSGHETTKHVLSSREMTFLLDLNAAMRSSKDAQTARRRVTKMLGEHLKADRVEFRERAHEASPDLGIIEEWQGTCVEPLGSEISFVAMPWVCEELEAGRVVAIEDVANDPKLADQHDIHRPCNVGAILVVPWMELGKLTALLFVRSREPQLWSDFDITTTERVLEQMLSWLTRERAAERERIMIREIDHRARNALAVVQSVVRLTAARDLETFRAAIEDRIAALGRTHDLLAGRGWDSVDLKTLVLAELSPYLGEDMSRADVEGPLISLSPALAQVVALVLHELTTNAVKHGALASNGGHLRIQWMQDDDGLLQLAWQETVAAERQFTAVSAAGKGFGSTLFTSVVEQQLGGDFDWSLHDSGLACRLSIPLGDGAERRMRTSSETVTAPQARAAKRVLIVEDEALLALDMAGMVEQLGYDVFDTVGTVDAGLVSLSHGRPDAAIVDANLDGQSSRPIVEALIENAVPMIYSSGYSTLDDVPDVLANTPKLRKPISIQDLATALETVMA